MSNVTLFPSCESVGIFFILPCTDSFVKVDLRTVSFDIPPQEVKHCSNPSGCSSNLWEMLLTEEPRCIPSSDPDQGLGYGLRGRSRVLPGQWPHRLCGQRGQRRLLHPPAGSDHTQECPRNQEPGGAPVRPRGHRSQHAGVFALSSEHADDVCGGSTPKKGVTLPGKVFLFADDLMVYSWQMALF